LIKINIRKLRGISVFLCCALIFSCFIGTPTVKAEDTINIGDYIVFGRYLGEPITWIVVDKNENGVCLFSKDILTIKPYDAAESGNAGKGNSDIEKYGSSEWYNSNIREWLNSSDKKVNYTTMPPNEKAVLYKELDYDKEKGFLYEFSEDEISLINLIKHEEVFDKIYIPSGDELKDINETGFDLRAKPTKMAVKTFKTYKISSGDWYEYFSRRAIDNTRILGKNICSEFRFRAVVCNHYSGVRPMTYLQDTLVINNGEGTEDNPYTLDIKKSSNSLADVSKNHWAYEAVKYLLKNGIIELNEDGTVKPEENISACEFLELISLGVNYNFYNKKLNFSEIKDKHWRNELLKIAGYHAGKYEEFDGELNIIREDAADTLIYALDLQDEGYKDNTLNKFSDKDEIEYIDSVSIAVENNLMIGLNGKFEPQKSLICAEAYMILYRIITGEF
jgi:hypothetical protein